MLAEIFGGKGGFESGAVGKDVEDEAVLVAGYRRLFEVVLTQDAVRGSGSVLQAGGGAANVICKKSEKVLFVIVGRGPR